MDWKLSMRQNCLFTVVHCGFSRVTPARIQTRHALDLFEEEEQAGSWMHAKVGVI